MGRMTIDYGIDLGTTNSAIAVLRGTNPVVIPNQDGGLVTPSVVWFDRRGQLFVGQRAKQHAGSDSENSAAEFKQFMGIGRDAERTFPRAGRTMLPEELSGEVIRSLRTDARQVSGEDIQAAVITVPAAFDLPQCDATRRAAEMAGLAASPLLQEPVAAGLAYGFQSEADRVFWLVYDFGGGTFDAAVIQARDGTIQVVNHEGDNRLGGKLIDWDIVQKKLRPALLSNCHFPDFQRGNERWRAVFATLKRAAEEAKIRVSRTGAPFTLWVEDLKDVESGEVVEFECTLTPSDIEEIAEPYVVRTLHLCKKALVDSRLAPSDIEKILMVGGTSLLPSLRQRLRDELGVPLEAGIDPITVVAQGAAIFAGTQRLAAPLEQLPPDRYRVELEYDPVGSDTDPVIGGRVVGSARTSFVGYTIEFTESKSQWRSGKIALPENGAFVTQVHAEPGRRCEFLIELCDPTGSRAQLDPERFPYTIGMVITSAPLTHAVGIAMANNRLDTLFQKGEPLPCRCRRIHRTTETVRRGSEDDAIRIAVVEGTNPRADRNTLIGYLLIRGDDPKVRRNVPTGSEVEITVSMDESRLMRVQAFVPILDEEFEKVITYDRAQRPVDELRLDFDREMSRLAEVQEKVERVDEPKAQGALARIRSENMLGQIEQMLSAAKGDREAVPECTKRLLDLKAAIDEAEDAVQWPSLVQEAHGQEAHARELVQQHGEPEEADRMGDLEAEARRAIASGDVDVLRRLVDDIEGLRYQILFRLPSWWVGYLDYLEEQRAYMKERGQADMLFAQGRRAIQGGDLEGLKASCRQLTAFLPPDEREKAAARGYGGTTILHER